MGNLVRFCYAVFMGFWRDAFGKDGYNLPVIRYRVVQHVISFLLTVSLLFACGKTTLCLSIWIALWVQIEWAIGHGPCYDIGTAGKPDEKMLKRYKKMLGYKLACKIFPVNEWYGFGFDFFLLAIRYTYPLIPICFFFNPVFLTLGLVIPALYAIYKHCSWLWTKRWADVELWVGFILGLYVAYL